MRLAGVLAGGGGRAVPRGLGSDSAQVDVDVGRLLGGAELPVEGVGLGEALGAVGDLGGEVGAATGGLGADVVVGAGEELGGLVEAAELVEGVGLFGTAGGVESGAALVNGAQGVVEAVEVEQGDDAGVQGRRVVLLGAQGGVGGLEDLVVVVDGDATQEGPQRSGGILRHGGLFSFCNGPLALVPPLMLVGGMLLQMDGTRLAHGQAGQWGVGSRSLGYRGLWQSCPREVVCGWSGIECDNGVTAGVAASRLLGARSMRVDVGSGSSVDAVSEHERRPKCRGPTASSFLGAAGQFCVSRGSMLAVWQSGLYSGKSRRLYRDNGEHFTASIQLFGSSCSIYCNRR